LCDLRALSAHSSVSRHCGPYAGIFFSFSAKIEPQFDASKVTMSGPGLESGKVGSPSKFNVDCTKAGEAPLAVEVYNEDGSGVPRVRVKDNGDGTHR